MTLMHNSAELLIMGIVDGDMVVIGNEHELNVHFFNHSRTVD